MSDIRVLEIGKVPTDILEKMVFKRLGRARAEIPIGSRIGEDASLVDLGGEYLITTTDPITGAVEKSGWLAVKVALNDIGASGGEPVAILVTILLKEGSTEEDLRMIMDDIHAACLEENVQVAGGHSEVTPGIDHTLIIVTALGKTVGRKFLSSCGARPGDDIVVTKWVGMEGTSILARDFSPILSRVLTESEMKDAIDLLKDISVTKDGRLAASFGATAAHDATEGGVLGAIYEICKASSVGATVFSHEMPVLSVTRKICDFAGIDPLKLVSSGCLVVATPSGEEICRLYSKNGINAKVVGKITSEKPEVVCEGKTLPLEPPQGDELWRARAYFQKVLEKKIDFDS